MSTVDTSTWNPDADLNVEIEGIPLNADAGIAQTWQALRVLMAAVKGDGDAIKAMIDVMQGATASADGASGLVPAPQAGDQDKVLKGNGTWGALSASDIPNIDASKITSGTIDIARLPAGALERLVTVADQTARFALTTADVQLGDTVKQLDTGVMYVVVDTSKLGQAGGYVEYTAGSAASVPWSGVTGKPPELAYLSGVTSAIQTQLDNRLPLSGGTMTGSITFNKTATISGESKSHSVQMTMNSGSLNCGAYDNTFSKWVWNVSPLGISSFYGNAATATQFAAAQTVTLEGDVAGTASSQAGWNIVTKRRSCMVGRPDSGTSNPWYKVATCEMAGVHIDAEAIFAVEDAYSQHTFGFLKVHLRTGGSATLAASACDITWLAHTGFTPSDFVLVLPAGASPTAELWTRVATGYLHRRFTVVSEGTLTTSEVRWDLLNADSEGQAASITTAGTQLASTEAGRTAYASVAGELQTSSDERRKTPLAAVPDAVLDAWEDVQWGQFQFLDAVESKGGSARLHLGLIAQRVKAAFEARRLDACAYGILCLDGQGMWTIRYAETLALEAACQRRRADRLEARVAALEALHG